MARPRNLHWNAIARRWEAAGIDGLIKAHIGEGGLGANQVTVSTLADIRGLAVGGNVGFFGVTRTGQQTHLTDPITASYGAVPSILGNVAVADISNLTGSLTWMINQVRAGVASINAALEVTGLLAAS